MATFAKLLVLIAIFLSASNANAFTSLSPVAGNQVQENHWLQFVEPMSKPTNKPIATTNSSQRGLCHGKKSELESSAEQPIATTNSSQHGLRHGKKSELESLAEQPIAATDSSQYNLPAGLCVHGLRMIANFPLLAGLGLHTANFSLPASLGLHTANCPLPAGLGLHSARTINLPAGLGLCSTRTINLQAGLGLRSANSSNLSADVGLRTASRNSNKMFQLIVRYVFTIRFKQQYQSQF